MTGTVVHNPIQSNPAQAYQSPPQKLGSGTQASFEDSFSANDRTFELSDSFGTQLSQQQPASTASKFNNPACSPDNRQLTGTGKYENSGFISEFELEDDLDEVFEAQTDKVELNEVMDNYKRILHKGVS